MIVRRLVPVALVAGAVVGVVGAVVGDDASTAAPGAVRSAGELPRERGPLRTALPGVALPRAAAPELPIVYPRIHGRDARVIATVPDPYGGPRWAVRTFRRPDVRIEPGPRRVTRGAVTCAQVGRLLRGRFVWIAPNARRATDVPVATTDNTVCTDYERAGVVGGVRVPVGRVGASRPTIAATAVWGISRRTGSRAALGSGRDALALPDLGGGARLVVRRGDVPLGTGRVEIDGRAVRGGVGSIPMLDPGGPGRAPSPSTTSGLRIDAVVADPASDRPKLLVSARQGAERCFAITGALVGGEPVRVVSRLGVLAPSFVQCTVPPRMATRGWLAVGGFAGSEGNSATGDRRRARERRTLPGYSASIIAVPRDVVELDVQDGTGVRTIRTVPLGGVRLAVSLGGGDLPLLPIAAGFATGQGRVLVGRTVAGRTVRLRAAQVETP